MRIGVLVSEYPSDEHRVPNVFVHNIVRGLQRLGHGVAVLLFDFRSPRKKRPFGYSTYEYEGVRVYRVAYPCGPVPAVREWWMRACAARLLRYAERAEGAPFDILHAHFGTMGYVARGTRRPFVLTEHSSVLFADGLRARISRRYFYKGYRAAARTVAVSGHLCARIAPHVPAGRLSVIPNVLNPVFAYGPTEKAQELTVISVGRLIGAKRYDLLLRAVAACEVPLRVQIVGDGPVRDGLRALSEELGIAQRVELLGRRTAEELAVLYRRAHLFALPSDGETFGVVYAEAQASGLPVVATDCGGPSDIVTRASGRLVPVGDVGALTAALADVATHLDRYDAAAIAADAAARFGEEGVCLRYQALYEEVRHDQNV